MRGRRHRGLNIILKTHDKSERPHLCRSCTYGTVIEGSGREITFCSEILKKISFRVEKCSGYNSKENTSIAAMREIAWTIETSKMGRIGFISPEERRRREN